MSLFSVFDISAAGMSVEQSRLAVAASNIANARTTRAADGAAYKPLTAVIASNTATLPFETTLAGIDAASLPIPHVAQVIESEAAPRLMYDPGHPDADEKGFVALPAVDPVTSMVDLLTIARGYEANIRTFDITRDLIQQTLDMGKAR